VQPPPRADDYRSDLGLAGEQAAAAYLIQLGYAIIEARWRCNFGEIDLIAREDGDIVFVEVRTRSGRTHELAFESVNPRKRAKLYALAEHYRETHGLSEQPCRFDVVAVAARQARVGWEFRCEVLRDAVGW